MFKDVPVRIVVPIIVVTWILSLISSLAIVYMVPSLFSVKSEQIGDGSITSSKIADGAIITVKLADGNVTSSKILDGNITAVDLADGSIITVKVANGAITTAKIVDGAITTAKIADSAIVTVKLANDSVTSEKIADGNVTASKIANGTITTVQLADGSVTSANILDGTITAADLGTGSVTTITIADGTITTAKIADFAVTNLKLASGAIPYRVAGSTTFEATSSTSPIDIPGMSVSITLTRTSALIIMFSTEAWLSGTGIYALYVRAMVGATQANPVSSTIILTASTAYACYSYTFYYPNVAAGTYTVKIQYCVYDAATAGHVNERTLTVIALPA